MIANIYNLWQCSAEHVVLLHSSVSFHTEAALCTFMNFKQMPLGPCSVKRVASSRAKACSAEPWGSAGFSLPHKSMLRGFIKEIHTWVKRNSGDIMQQRI